MSSFPDTSSHKLIFAFPGQGSDPCGALCEVYKLNPQTTDLIDEILAIVEREAVQNDPSMLPGLITNVLLTHEHSLPLPSGVAQLAQYAASVVLNRVLDQAGIRPELIVAQSFGEIASRVCAGVFDIAEGTRAVGALNMAYRAEEGLGGMVRVDANAQDTQNLLDTMKNSSLVLASINTPSQCVVSGENADIERLLALPGKALPTRHKIEIAYASHFPAHTRVAEDLYTNLQTVPQYPFHTPILSTVLGRAYSNNDDLHKLFTLGVLHPTDLPGTLLQLVPSDQYLFVDMGVNKAMAHCVRKSLRGAQTYTPLVHTVTELRATLSVSATASVVTRGSSSAGQTADVIRYVVNGPTPSNVREEVKRIFANPFFSPQRHLSSHDAHRLTYDQLQYLLKKLPTGIHGFAEPEWVLALAEWAGITNPSLFMACVIQHGLCIGTLLAFEAGHPYAADWRQQLESGEKCSAYAITEIGRSNSHLGACVEAVFDSVTREFVLHTPNDGALKFANVGVSDRKKLGVVFAQLMVNAQPCGVFPFVLDISDENGPRPGIGMSSPAHIPAVPLDYGLLRFDQVRIPFHTWLHDSATISPAGVFDDPLGSTDKRLVRSLFAPKNVWVMVGIALSSAMLVCATQALTHTSRRTTQARIGNGTGLLEFRTQRRALFRCLAIGYVMKCFANDSARIWITSVQNQSTAQATGTGAPTFTPWVEISSRIALTKALAAPAAEEVATQCRLLCGVAGALSSNRFYELEGMAKIYQDAGGNNRMIILDAAKALVTQPLAQPSVPNALSELTAPETWLYLVRTREYRLLSELAEHVSQQSAQGKDQMDIWNPQLMKVQYAGGAHAKRLAMESAALASTNLALGLAKDLLDALTTVYALDYLREHAAWFISEGLLDNTQYLSIEDLLNALSDYLAQHAHMLIDALGYGSATQAPISNPDDYASALANSLQWKVGKAN